MKTIVGYIALIAPTLFVMGCCSTQPSREQLEADCRSNIFHGMYFTFGSTNPKRKPLIVQHIKDGKTIEEFTVLFEDGFHSTKRTIFGDDTYLLKADNEVHVLTELKGSFHIYCTNGFGCKPGCEIESYKIDNQRRISVGIHLGPEE